MRKLFSLLLAFLFLVASLSSLVAQPAGGEVVHRNVPAPSIKDNMFAIPTEQPIAVYLPPSYKTTTQRYPVIYFLPGFADAVRLYSLYGLYQGFILKQSMDQLISQSSVKEMMVVIANGMTVTGGSFYVNSPVNGNWEDFIVKDVVGYVDKNFRTIQSAKSRGLSGHSMGGFGALNIAMHHPDVFGEVFAMSPGLFAPGGLSKARMFADTNTIIQFIETEQRIDAMKRDESVVRFLSWVSHLLSIEMDYGRTFAYAYGAAFSPDTKRNAPFIRYPFKRIDNRLVVDSVAWKQYDNGFGNLQEKVKHYRTNLLKLNAIGVEFGASDEVAFIPDGCRYYSQLLTEAGVKHDLVTYEGGHQDKIRERLEQHMLPFFSRNLAFK